jgi:hypothetical protein
VPKTQGPLVVDRSTGRRLQVEVRWGPALEALLGLLILNGGAPFDRYERGEEIARLAKRRLPASVDHAVGRLRTPAGDHWTSLLGLVATGEPPYDLVTVVDRLKDMDPTALKLRLLGVHRLPADAGPVVDVPAPELATLVVEAIRDLPPDLYLEGSDAVGLLERNAADARRLLAEADDAEAVIERLTRGLVYRGEPGIDGALLIPTLVHRPWTLVLDHEQTKLFFYPAQLDQELSAPDRDLIGIYRALGDGTRLRILRRLAAGTATVGRISEELGLAKSTVHEHLLSLRTAGLVRLPKSGGFELEPELPDLNWMLKEFLGLEMRRQCERCGTPLEPDGVAYICSYECTFCRSCTETLGGACPNCTGELVLRPRRSAARPQLRRTRTPHSVQRHSGSAKTPARI